MRATASCLRCRRSQPIVDSVYRYTKRGQLIQHGKCLICGTPISCFLTNAERREVQKDWVGVPKERYEKN